MCRLISLSRILLVSLSLLLISACADDNEHFCARYNYLYEQLSTEQDLPTYGEMKQTLLAEIAKDGNEQSKMMLFVLEDFHIALKPGGEDAYDTCMRLQRWQAYH